MPPDRPSACVHYSGVHGRPISKEATWPSQLSLSQHWFTSKLKEWLSLSWFRHNIGEVSKDERFMVIGRDCLNTSWSNNLISSMLIGIFFSYKETALESLVSTVVSTPWRHTLHRERKGLVKLNWIFNWAVAKALCCYDQWDLCSSWTVLVVIK